LLAFLVHLMLAFSASDACFFGQPVFISSLQQLPASSLQEVPVSAVQQVLATSIQQLPAILGDSSLLTPLQPGPSSVCSG